MPKHIVKCLVCGEPFDTNEEKYKMEGRRYIHNECAEKKKQESFFIDDIHTYISHIYGTMYSKINIDKQIKEMMKDGKTPEQINLALKYWYSIRKEDPAKSKGSIRIVNYIFQEAMDYYARQYENKNINSGIDINEILNQEAETVVITRKPIGRPKRVKIFDLD